MADYDWIERNPSTTLTAYDTGIRRLSGRALVECPKCEACAFSIATCATCRSCGWNVRSDGGPRKIVPYAVDPFFGLPLWLRVDVRTHTLWAYNSVHLAFLRLHIEAPIRTRWGKRHTGNGSLGSRLPQWMTAAKARDDVLKGITRLERRLEAAVQ